MALQFYVVDLETTGLSTSIHEVTEISIIRCYDKMQLTEFVKCETPETASMDALRITNKSFDDLLKGSSKEAAIAKVEKFLSEDGLTPAHRCFIAHNASFDRRFLHSIFSKVGKECPVNNWICSMALTKKYAKQIGLIKPKVGLSDACNLVGIKKFSGAHASKFDTRNAYLLWKDLVDNKKIDYLDLLKVEPHSLKEEDCYLEPDFNDNEKN